MRRLVGILAGVILVLGATGYGAWALVAHAPPAPAEPAETRAPAPAPAEVAPGAPAATPVPVPPCDADPSLTEQASAVPADLAAALQHFVADPRVRPHAAGVSVWIDGYGEVLTHDPDLALAPASNQKVFTAIGALAVIGTEPRLVTEVLVTPDDDLVVVGGGDPTVATTGPHSLDALATQVAAAGVTHLDGALLVDESRHDGTRRASGWFEWQVPRHTGPMSAFMVDANRWRGDPAFLADPALANLERLRARLAARGVTIAGPTGYATAPVDGAPVASLVSPTIAELVGEMLRRSDNQIADMLLKEAGFAATGRGSADAAATATVQALEPLCLHFGGTTDDGSGLSRANLRSAREWRTLLQAVRGESWFPTFYEGLPVAARTGTLTARFGETAAAGNVAAKTGTIIGGTALSGYGTTAGGRGFVFSVVVNGEGTQAAASSIDALVASVAAHPG